MDAFFASVEQRDFPQYKGLPLVVGGKPGTRGVVAAASYEARKYGVRSAMPSTRAAQLCPGLLFVKPRFDVYRQVSEQIREIFFSYTDLVEPLSLDEAYLDVSENKIGQSSATKIACAIKQKIFQTTELTASAGVSNVKFLAKIASDINKPDGLTVIPPQQVDEFLQSLPIGRFFGVGRVTEKKMLALGITSGRELRQKSEAELVHLFGKQGLYFYQIARGQDTSQVIAHKQRKSLGVERTYPKDLISWQQVKEEIDKLLVIFWQRKEKAGVKGKTLTLKIKYFDFTTITRSYSPGLILDEKQSILNALKQMMQETTLFQKKIRLLGITLSHLIDDRQYEPDLFGWSKVDPDLL